MLYEIFGTREDLEGNLRLTVKADSYEHAKVKAVLMGISAVTIKPVDVQPLDGHCRISPRHPLEQWAMDLASNDLQTGTQATAKPVANVSPPPLPSTSVDEPIPVLAHVADTNQPESPSDERLVRRKQNILVANANLIAVSFVLGLLSFWVTRFTPEDADNTWTHATRTPLRRDFSAEIVVTLIREFGNAGLGIMTRLSVLVSDVFSPSGGEQDSRDGILQKMGSFRLFCGSF